MEIKILSMDILNFKGIKSLHVGFDMITKILGRNGSGKSSIVDAFMWVLFDKDSKGNSKFEIRPLDMDGNKIHHLDIAVIITLEINGKKIQIKKAQKENWVKKRGSQNPVLQGNINEYEIDGFPKGAKEFQKFISEIIDEQLFKLLTNPTFFTSLPWKEQRNILMSFVQQVTDVELAMAFGSFDLLLDDLEKANSLEDIRKKYSKAKSEYNRKLTEIPARIDELNNNRTDDNVDDLRANITLIETETEVNQNRIVSLQNKISAKQKMMDDVLKLKFKRAEIIEEAKARKSKVEGDKFLAERQIRNLEAQVRMIGVDIERLEKENAYLVQCNKDREKKIGDVAGRYFPKKAENCPTCGQRLPEDQLLRAEEQFNQDKEVEIASLEKARDIAFESILTNDRQIAAYRRTIEECEQKIKALKETIEGLTSKVETITADTSDIDAKIKLLEDSMEDTEQTQKDIDGIRNYISMLDERRREVEKRLMKADNSKIDDRIAELQQEQIDTAQAVADCEQKLYLLDSFIQQKLDAISDTINCSFDGITFKLFENQINGGVREVCEVAVDGVPFGSLNNGHRIIAGLQIIRSLQMRFGVLAPVWIDNAESISEGNIPDMDCQVIELYVNNGDLEVR